MAVFRINKTNDYTIMSNRHLKEKDMSLKLVFNDYYVNNNTKKE